MNSASSGSEVLIEKTNLLAQELTRHLEIQRPTVHSASLIRAVVNDDLEDLRRLIVMGANLNELYIWSPSPTRAYPHVKYHLTLLTLAVHCGSRRGIRLLLRKGADPNCVGCDVTPLGAAVRNNDIRRIVLLMQSGADINQPTHLLLYEVHGTVCSHYDKQTVLHIACLEGFQNVVRYLLCNGASLKLTDGWRNDALEIAQSRGHKDIAQEIMEFVGQENYLTPQNYKIRRKRTQKQPRKVIFTEQSFRRTNLHMACIKNSIDKVKYFASKCKRCVFDKVDIYGNTPLHYACANGRHDIIEILVSAGADVDLVNSSGKTPVEVTLEFGDLQLALFLVENCCKVPVRLLHARNSGGNTLLHIALKQRKHLAVFRLISVGGDLIARNNRGDTPLHLAWRSGGTDVLNFIANYVFDFSFMPCLLHFDGHGERMNLRRRCKVFRGSNGCDNTTHILSEYKPNTTVYIATLNALSQQIAKMQPGTGPGHEKPRTSPFCPGCQKLCLEAAYMLLHGDNRNIDQVLAASCNCTVTRTTLLHVVCSLSCFHRGTCFHGKSNGAKLLEQLCIHGIGANSVDCHGRTPLHLLCRRDGNFRRPIEVLLKHGADHRIKDDDGKTPLWFAFDSNRCDFLQWLIKEKALDVDGNEDVMQGFNSKGNTLLIMMYENHNDDKLIMRLVEHGARLNPPTSSAGDVKRTRLLDKVLYEVNYSADCLWLARSLIAAGCRDYTMKNLLLLSNNNNPSPNCIGKWWRCLHLAGVRMQSPDILMAIQRVGKEGSRSDFELLQSELDIPPSLVRQCVYTIRRQLTDAEPLGRSIWMSASQLNTAKPLQDMIKLSGYLQTETDFTYENTTNGDFGLSRPIFRVDWCLFDFYDYSWETIMFTQLHDLSDVCLCDESSRHSDHHANCISDRDPYFLYLRQTRANAVVHHIADRKTKRRPTQSKKWNIMQPRE